MAKFVWFLCLGVIGSVLDGIAAQEAPAGLNLGDDDVYFNDIQRLRDVLLKNYDRHSRPARKHKEPLRIGIGLAVTHLEVDELTAQFIVHGWLSFRWKDERLVWNSSEYDELGALHLPYGVMWQPDLVLYNNAEASEIGHYAETHSIVYSDGTVLWIPSSRLPTLCQFDLRYWPYDTQVCQVKMGSWTHDGGKLELYKLSEEVTTSFMYVENGEWAVINNTVSINLRKYNCCPDVYPDITFELKIKRRSELYQATVFVPSIVIVMLTMATFLLPPNAGEKIIIGVVNVAILCCYMIQFSNTLPAMANRVPLIVLFYKNTLVAIGVSVVLSVTTISTVRIPKANSPPAFLVNIFTSCMGTLLGLGSLIPLVMRVNVSGKETLKMSGFFRGSDNMGLAEEEMAPGRDPAYSFDTEPKARFQERIDAEWYLVASGCDRIIFCFYLVTLAIMMSSMI